MSNNYKDYRNYHELSADQKYVLVLWCLGAIVFLLTLTFLFINELTYKVIVARQPNPMEYSCALDTFGTYVNPTCVIYWQNKAGN